MDASEPLGLPRGTVRAVMAVAVLGVCLYLFAVGAEVPGELLTLMGTVTTFYFLERTRENVAEPQSEKVEDPYLPDDESAA